MDPGTCLGVVSLALQVSKGLLAYYELWTHADDDIDEIKRSLLSLATIFAQLDITLRKPSLAKNIVSIIQLTLKGCRKNIDRLEGLLEKVKKEGSPSGLRARLKEIRRHSLYIFYAKDIQDTKSLLDELRQDLNLAIGLLNLNTTASSLEELRRLLADVTALRDVVDNAAEACKKSVDDKNRKALLTSIRKWLSPCNISSIHAAAYGDHEPGTGRWFLDSSRFASWRTSAGPQLLWVAGDVGCGKTTLCAMTVEELRSAATSSGTSVGNIAYFYFAFDDPDRQDLSGLVKSMLAQLCLGNQVYPELEELFDRVEPHAASTKELIATLLAALKRSCASPEFLLGGEARLGAATHTYVIIDGIDEIPFGPQRTAVLRFLQSLSQGDYFGLHVVVSSRPEWDIETEFLNDARWTSLRVSEYDISVDLDTYIRNQIADVPKLRRQPDSIKEEIHHKLVHGARGMFRWTALQMQELKARRILRSRDIESILSALPRDLDATYERILESIDPSLADEAEAALQWLACYSRPLYIEELAEACIIFPDNTPPFEEDRRLHPLDILEVLPGLIKVSPPLHERVVCPKKRHIISLAHFSVKEYLFNDRIKDGAAHCYAINWNLANTYVTRSCLAYISHHLPTIASAASIGFGGEEPPLLLYAFRLWLLHTQWIATCSSQQIAEEAIAIFQQPRPAIAWSELTARRCKVDDGGSIVEIPAEAFADPRWPRYYLLCRAIEMGNETIVTLLLESGLRVDQDHVLGGPFGLAVTFEGARCCDNFGPHPPVGATDRDTPTLGCGSIARLLLKYGYRPKASEIALAAQHSPRQLVSLILENKPCLSLPEWLSAVNAGVNSSRYDNARLLMDHLCAEHTGMSSAHFDQVLEAALAMKSKPLISFLMTYVSAEALRGINIDVLFVGVILHGYMEMASAMRDHPRIHVSSQALIFAQDWDRIMNDDPICNFMLFIWVTRLRTILLHSTNTRSDGQVKPDNLVPPLVWRLASPGSVDQFQRAWGRLSTTLESHPMMSAITYESRFGGIIQEMSSGMPSPSPHHRLLTYLVLSGPWRLTIEDIFQTELLRSSLVMVNQGVVHMYGDMFGVQRDPPSVSQYELCGGSSVSSSQNPVSGAPIVLRGWASPRLHSMSTFFDRPLGFFNNTILGTSQPVAPGGLNAESSAVSKLWEKISQVLNTPQFVHHTLRKWNDQLQGASSLSALLYLNVRTSQCPSLLSLLVRIHFQNPAVGSYTESLEEDGTVALRRDLLLWTKFEQRDKLGTGFIDPNDLVVIWMGPGLGDDCSVVIADVGDSSLSAQTILSTTESRKCDVRATRVPPYSPACICGPLKNRCWIVLEA